MIKTAVKDNGFEGILFEGNGSKEKVMIVMSGSNGGMKLTEDEARFYDENGIPALALALFGTKCTQPSLDRVPVEYVENAIRWLKEKGYQKIGIDGMSKGSEMALLAASMFEDISCVIARVPSHFVSEGLTGSGKNKAPSSTSCWSYRGKEIAYAPYKTRKFNLMKLILQEREMHIISYNIDKTVTKESMIEIEKIKAPVLLLSSKNDTVWPSYESSVYMEKKFSDAGFKWEHRHIGYEHISHAMLTKLPFIYKLAFKAERNDAQGCRTDREKLKKDLLNWVNETWK